jgi:hypothetical protein
LLPLPTYKCQNRENYKPKEKKEGIQKNENKKWPKTEKRG